MSQFETPHKKHPNPWRRTPLIHSAILSKHAGCQIFLKLENLQPSGSFKSRGIGNFLLSHLLKAESSTSDVNPNTTHFYTSSGGNAGLACVHAAVTLSTPATVIVPLSTTPYMISKLRAAGAEDVIQHGASWYEADRYLRETIIPEAKSKGVDAVYVPPFDHPDVWEGNRTMVGEILEDLNQLEGGQDGNVIPDALLCSVGGGGLFSGIMTGLERAGLPSLRVLACETKGADSLSAALEAGKLVTLPGITSIATSLGARTVAARAFEFAQGKKNSVTSVVVDDDVAKEGCVRFADDERINVEPACGVCLGLCYEGRLKKWIPGLKEESRVVIVVCGGSNISVEVLHHWAEELSLKN